MKLHHILFVEAYLICTISSHTMTPCLHFMKELRFTLTMNKSRSKVLSPFSHSVFMPILLLQILAQSQTGFLSFPYSPPIIFDLLFSHACWSCFQDTVRQFAIKLPDHAVFEAYLFSAISPHAKLRYLHFSKCAVSFIPFITISLRLFPYMHNQLPCRPSFGRA